MKKIIIIFILFSFAVSARPKEKIPDPPSHENRKAIIFPARHLEGFLITLESQKKRIISDKELESGIKTILPAGVYTFTESCPLIRNNEEPAGIVEYRIECISEHRRHLFPLRFVVDANSDVRNLLFRSSPSQKIMGKFELLRIQVHKRKLHWLWREIEPVYVNPFFRILQKNFPGRTEQELLERESIEETLPQLMTEASLRSTKESKWVKDFHEVFSKGRRIRFYEACPLILERPFYKEPGDERTRAHFRISCMPRGPLSDVYVYLYEGFKETAGKTSGEAYFAELKFHKIREESGLFRIEWDTIYNIKARNSGDVLLPP